MDPWIDPDKLIRQLFLTPGEALLLSRFSRDLAAAERTARNMMVPDAAKPFPFPLSDVLGKKRVRRTDFLKTLDLEADAGFLAEDAISSSTNIVRRQPGRPRNGGPSNGG